MGSILVINGPNLNLLGSREPALYGNQTLAEIDANLAQIAAKNGHQVQSVQSNAEHELIDRVHAAAKDGTGFIIINPGAFSHTSIALRDALLGAALPFIEVHLSNIHAREVFRHHSYFSDIAVGVICGLGAAGYEYALQSAMQQLQRTG